jgi:hypothetical protein
MSAIVYRLPIQRLLGWKSARIILLLLIIAVHTPRELFERTGKTDQFFQIAGAQSIRLGRGYTFPVGTSDDLAQIKYAPLVGWPPLYSLMLAPLLAGPIWLAMALLNIFAIIIFFVAWLVILELLGDAISVPAKIAVLLFWALGFTPLSWAYSDSLSLAFYSAGIAVAFYGLKRDSLFAAAVSGLLVGLSGGVRFAYWPLVVIIPLALAVYGFRHDRRCFRLLIAHGLVVGVVLLALILWQQQATGSVNYLSSYYPPEKQGFFWDQLRPIPPILISPLGLMDLNSINDRRQIVSPWLINAFLWILSGGVLVTFLYQTVAAFRGNHESRWREVFYTIGIMTIAICIAEMAYLSIRYKSTGFSYIAEIRYYMPLFPFIVVSLAMTVFNSKPFNIRHMGRIVLGIVLAFAFILGIYRQFNILAGVPWTFPADEGRLGPRAFPVYNQMSQAARNGNSVVFITGDDMALDVPRTAALITGSLGLRYTNQAYTTSKPLIIILGIPHEPYAPPEQIAAMTAFCHLHHCEDIEDTPLLHLYRFTLLPSTIIDKFPVDSF